MKDLRDLKGYDDTRCNTFERRMNNQFRANREQLRFNILLPESQGQNLALTVSCVTKSLDAWKLAFGNHVLLHVEGKER